MELTLLLLTLFFLSVIIVILKNNRTLKKDIQNLSSIQENTTTEEKMPYAQKFILTKNEYIFYKILKEICDEKEWLICPKITLKELFNVTLSKYDKEYRPYLSKIDKKHIDFTICNKDLYPIYAIELDDNSHKDQDRIKSDNFKNKIFENSKIKLIRVKARNYYTKESISSIFETLKAEPSAETTPQQMKV